VPIDPIAVASPTPDARSGAVPSRRASEVAPASMPPDRIEKDDAHGPSQTYNADILRNAVNGTHAVAASAAAATMGAVQRAGAAVSELGPRVASATTAAAPIAGETLGAAGLVVTMQSSAGNAGEDAPNATWRHHSNAVADRTPRQVHTTFPGQRVDIGPNHTTNPTHVRPAKDGILTTPAETSTRLTHTGHAAPELRELSSPTGTAIHQPSATDQATFAKQDRIVTPAHAAHLTNSGNLVNGDKAIIPSDKLTRYALDPNHPRGGDKARVFKAALGYDQSSYGGLDKQIRVGIQREHAEPGASNEYGSQFSVDIPVTGPAGSAIVRTGWIYDKSSDVPRLTTAFVKK
jgi:hypothetical protein